MLPGAEANLKPNLRKSTRLAKIVAWMAALFGRQRELGKKRFEQTRLPRAQLRPLAAAVMLAPERQVRMRL